MGWARLALLLQLGATLPLVGLIWLVQIVSYSLGRFAEVERIDHRFLRRSEAVGKHLLLNFSGASCDGARPREGVGALRSTRRSIGAVLLDQRVLAGIGNMYRAELLFLLGVHPETPARELDHATFDALWEKARARLALGVTERRIVTVRHPSSMRFGRPVLRWYPDATPHLPPESRTVEINCPKLSPFDGKSRYADISAERSERAT